MNSLIDKISKKTKLSKDQATDAAEVVIQHLKLHVEPEMFAELEKVLSLSSEADYEHILSTRFGTLKSRMKTMKVDMDEFFRNRKSMISKKNLHPAI